ncbi:L-threonylcarbamoyladenylate synthase [Candidatus Epulonipiscium viviparus]|uniref:L-threonylcarbamoyladenylate synthase n=1 Tax=Candidatus Epulonipiscium viviparus TaxID=420336 RepID=UPI00016C0B40|nr:L-threonylcarbamoyladenylate synthase [Candidatus Epulopiscium viviparus]
MDTIILSKTDNLELAINILKNGGLVVSPTETVYGLCANALDENAVENIFKAKGRPADNPLIVHIASLAMLDQLVAEISANAQKLIDAFWPGPLTLIFKSQNIIPNKTRANLQTVAIRFPENKIIIELIKKSKLPLAAPSANTSGKPSPTNIDRVIEDLFGKVDCIIDGGNCKIGLESTVVDVSGDNARILRPGFITAAMLEKIVPSVSAPASAFPIAPGMKYKHYAPSANVAIVDGNDLQEIAKKICCLIKKDRHKRAGVLIVDEMISFFEDIPVVSLGSITNLESIASNLFEKLRQLDDLKLEQVYTIYLHDKNLGLSIMNRLLKASNNQIIY